MPPLVGGGIRSGVIEPDEDDGGDDGDGGEFAKVVERWMGREK